jgi:hypothetical protein
VEEVLTSVNAPYVAPQGYTTEATRAYLCTIKRGGDKLSIYIYLHLTQTNKGVMYCFDKDPISVMNYSLAKEEAMEFAESMGFIMEKAEVSTNTLKLIPPFMEDLSLLKKDEEEEDIELKEIPSEGAPKKGAKVEIKSPPAKEEEEIELEELPSEEAAPKEVEAKPMVSPPDKKEEQIEIEVEEKVNESAKLPPPVEEQKLPAGKRVIGKIKIKQILPPSVEDGQISKQLKTVLRFFSSL